MEEEQQNAKMFEDDAAKGDALAQCNLGLCYLNGHGVARNEALAVKWFTKSASQGDADAQYSLGTCYLNGVGVFKNESVAVEWYTKSAAQGNAFAQYCLGRCYQNGFGVAVDGALAVEWYKKSAAQGDALGQNGLGTCYKKGTGVSKNEALALEWFTKSAAQGDAFAQHNVGWCYQNGFGVVKNITSAVEWYRKAAAQGVQAAKSNLRELSMEVPFVPPAEKRDNQIGEEAPARIRELPSKRASFRFFKPKEVRSSGSQDAPPETKSLRDALLEALKMDKDAEAQSFAQHLEEMRIDAILTNTERTLRVLSRAGKTMTQVTKVITVLQTAMGPYSAAFIGVQLMADAVLGIVKMIHTMYLNDQKCRVLRERVEALNPTINQLQHDLVSKLEDVLTCNPPLSRGDIKHFGDDIQALAPLIQKLGKVLGDIKHVVDTWQCSGKKLWGKVKKMFKAKNFEKKFVELADNLREAEMALSTALTARTYIKLDRVVEKMPDWRDLSEKWKRDMEHAVAEDKAELAARLKELAATDEEFKNAMLAQFKEVKRDLQVNFASNFAAVHDMFQGIVLDIATEHKKTNAHISSEMDSLRVEIREALRDRVKFREIAWKELTMEGMVGEGGYGVVYRAQWGERVVAVKQLHLQQIGGRDLDEIKAELVAEADKLEKVASPFVVELKGVVFEKSHHAIVMEFAAPDLSFFLSSVKELDWRQRFRIATEIALGLQAVHKAGVVHHDLRAANVLLGSQPRFCRLTDFGLAKAKHTSSCNSKSKTGNFVWLAPEYQCQAEAKYTEACDVFSFGVTLFEIATLGHAPFRTRSDAEIRQMYKERVRDKLLPEVPAQFRQLVESCWSQNPEKRPSASEIVEYLEKTKMADARLTI